MDSLPLEIVFHTTSFLFLGCWKAGSKLLTYATISRPWQLAIESRTFEDLTIRSTELPFFIQTISQQPYRRRLLLTLLYEVVLPTYTDEQCAKFETTKAQQMNNHAFTHIVHDLLQFLRTWQDTDDRQDLFLAIEEAYSPTDHRRNINGRLQEDKNNAQRRDLGKVRYKHLLLHLLEQPDLPTLTCVTGLRVTPSDRLVQLHSAVLLATKFPNLQSIEPYLPGDDTGLDAQKVQQYRHGELYS